MVTIEVPHYEELSVKNIYPSMKKDPDFQSYFPDKYPKGKAPPREYFFNVLHTLQPDYLTHVELLRAFGKGGQLEKAQLGLAGVRVLHQCATHPNVHGELRNTEAIQRFQMAYMLSRDRPTQVFLQRCLFYRKHNPPANWDLVWNGKL